MLGTGERRHRKIVEILRRIHDENRDVDHARAPLFAVRLLEKNRQAANGMRRVSLIWLSARQRKASHDGYPARAEDLGLGERLPLAIALEIAGDTDSLGVIPAKSRMLSVQMLKHVDQCRGSKRVRREPAARIHEETRDHCEQRADASKPCEQSCASHWSRGRFRNLIRLIGCHDLLP